MIASDDIREKFKRMGADVTFEDRRWKSQSAPVIDVVDDTFVIDTRSDPKAKVRIIDTRPKERHLLLMVRSGKGEVSKYLMGHDERHWFVAAVPELLPVRNVADAMEALKPIRVKNRQKRLGVTAKDRNRRHQEAYIRQGEWFFMPAPQLTTAGCVSHCNEPIQRGRGKPHFCEELIRKDGYSVWVHGIHAPNGLTQAAFKKLPRKVRETFGWSTAFVSDFVYARGYVRHQDHKTIHLKEWHRVLPNTENKARAFEHLKFLD